MKYNTPRQRIKIYERLIRMIDRGDWIFMCNEIKKLTSGSVFGSITIKNHFPELWKVRPKHITNDYATLVWYTTNALGMQRRKAKLLKAIEIAKSNI